MRRLTRRRFLRAALGAAAAVVAAPVAVAAPKKSGLLDGLVAHFSHYDLEHGGLVHRGALQIGPQGGFLVPKEIAKAVFRHGEDWTLNTGTITVKASWHRDESFSDQLKRCCELRGVEYTDIWSTKGGE